MNVKRKSHTDAREGATRESAAAVTSVALASALRRRPRSAATRAEREAEIHARPGGDTALRSEAPRVDLKRELRSASGPQMHFDLDFILTA